MATSDSIFKTMGQRAFGDGGKPKKRNFSDSGGTPAKKPAAHQTGPSQGQSTPATGPAPVPAPGSAPLPAPASTSTQRPAAVPAPSADSQPATAPKPVRIPAFIVDAKTVDWPSLAAEVKTLDPGVDCVSRGETYRIKATSVESFRKIQRRLYNKGVQFHTFSFKTSRSLKVVISGLPSAVDEDLLYQLLEGKKFSVESASRLRTRRGPTKSWLVVFNPDGEKEEDEQPASAIYRVSSLYEVRISVSAYRKPAGPPQCHRCQRYGHGSSYCNMAPRCVRCGGPHRRQDCLKSPEEKGVCCNCGGEHNASYRGCPAFKEVKRRPAEIQRPARPSQAAPTRQRPRPLPAVGIQTTETESEDREEDSGFQKVKRRKRQPRNPDNRKRRTEESSTPGAQPAPPPPPSEPDPPLPFRKLPLPRPQPRPDRREDSAPAETAETTNPERPDVAALLREVLAQLTALTGLLTQVLPLLARA